MTRTLQRRDISQYCTKVLVPSAVSRVNLGLMYPRFNETNIGFLLIKACIKLTYGIFEKYDRNRSS